MPVGVTSQDWATQLGLDTAAPWRTGALDVTRQATASGHFINARCYTSEAERRGKLGDWLHYYNHHRPHPACGNQPPFSRLTNIPGQFT